MIHFSFHPGLMLVMEMEACHTPWSTVAVALCKMMAFILDPPISV